MKGFAAIIILVAVLAQDGIKERASVESRLIAPGIGSDKALIGERFNEFFKRNRNLKYKISRVKQLNDVFSDVLKINTDVKVYFSEAYDFEESSFFLFTADGIITAVAGTGSDKYTMEGVDLKNGCEFFLFSYGNTGLVNVDTDTSAAYIYPRLGIAVFDDGKNDTIDLYLVFPPKV